MASFIGFLVLIIILGLAVSAAFATYITLSKGRSFTEGILLGTLLPFIGIIIAAILPTTDEKIADEMYERDIINLGELEKTREIIIQKNKKN